MKKFMKWYMKATVEVFVIYALVAWIGDKIIAEHPLKDKEQQSYMEFLFAVMKYSVLSPYYTVRWIINK